MAVKTLKPKPRRKLPPNIGRGFGLDIGTASQWVSLGHDLPAPQAPKEFGAPRFTLEQQAANPTARMTRLVKDVIYPKKWLIGKDAKGPVYWDCTADALGLVRSQFKLAQSRGVAFNLAKSHGDLSTCTVPSDDVICPIDDCVQDQSGRLWISVYVTPEEAVWLQNPARKTSPGFKPGWVDGEGRSYPIQLYHVAVVDGPVVTGQGAFIAMANTQGGSSMDFEETMALFQRIFAVEGMTLPDSLTPENAIPVLDALVSTLETTEGEEDGEEDPAPAGEGNAPPPPIPGDPAAMSNDQTPAWAKGLMDQVAALSNRINASEVADKKGAFESQLQALVVAGKIPQKSVIAMRNAGNEANWSPAVLAPFADMAPMIPQGRQSRALANPQAPHMPKGNLQKVDEIVAEVIGSKTRVRKPLV